MPWRIPVHLQNVCFLIQIVVLPKVTQTTHTHPVMVPSKLFRSQWQKCKYIPHRKQRSWKMPALMPVGPRPEVSPNPKGQATGRWAKSTQSRCGEGEFMDSMKSHGTSSLCAGIFQQFRTGSEPVSGGRCCRWVFKQPTCKWSLAKIPWLTAFFLCVWEMPFLGAVGEILPSAC